MINFSKKNFISHCKKCKNNFQHEENLILFKSHHYHSQCFLCIDCKKQLTHESFYLDEKYQLDVEKKTHVFLLKEISFISLDNKSTNLL